MGNAGISIHLEFTFNLQLSLLPIIFSVPSMYRPQRGFCSSSVWSPTPSISTGRQVPWWYFNASKPKTSNVLLVFACEFSAYRETESAPVWKTTSSFSCVKLVNVAIT